MGMVVALMSCPECQAQVSDKAASCPHCGYPLQAVEPTPALDVPAVEAPAATPETLAPARIYAYPCPMCLEGFDEGPDLYRHKKTVHYVKGGSQTIVRYVDSTPKPTAPRPTAPMGLGSRAMVCPHCQTSGRVSTRQVKAKKGISGGKATGALLTGGLSILATGLSRKEMVTQAHCSNCGATWTF
jgi:hypothetical protein